MSMVFCSGCAKEIHSTAAACPQCGAPQLSKQAFTAPNAGAQGNPYIEVLKKYAVFNGRASRREYWMFILINLGISIAFIVLDTLLQTPGIFSNIYSLAVFLPGLAAAIRRMHDTDRSGWWILLPIVNIVFLAQDSQPGVNRFGPNPKGIN
ncbi:DUF805 domain-containing protein [Pseudomonas prosekii]|uniref:DUF805 domain-containing protein n=1 Tax=Pseudomonas prosekii TaxID=1148509 RepID=UPI0011EB9A97|nr:DUF805 domain-containing protein [Pseudomonas prosekii]